MRRPQLAPVTRNAALLIGAENGLSSTLKRLRLYRFGSNPTLLHIVISWCDGEITSSNRFVRSTDSKTCRNTLPDQLVLSMLAELESDRHGNRGQQPPSALLG
jgi:hypothetical protein